MFGTCIAVFDGYGRVLDKTTELLFPKRTKLKNKYSICILILIIGTFLITYEFDKSGDFGILVNFATSISFLIAPIIAIFNYLVVNRYLDNKFVPPKWLNYLSIIGVLYLILFSILYLFKNYLFT
jgi:Mn2+/Fe2+ NRAMP family transporter